MGHGHPEARFYPLGMLNDEAAIVLERVNGRIVTDATLVQLAAGSIMSKKARSQFARRTKELTVEAKAKPGLFERD